MKILLDTGILGELCHPSDAQSQPAMNWVTEALARNAEVILPEICDYELRRKLLHLIRKGQSKQRSIDRLDELGKLLDYLPLDTDTMLRAAELWADARSRGLPTAPDHSLDGDVILAAQTLEVGGMVVTNNPKHLSRFVTAQLWQDLAWQ
jgi:predicted nucleic acid-binding protein